MNKLLLFQESAALYKAKCRTQLISALGLLLVLFSANPANAQLNYSFSTNSASYVPLTTSTQLYGANVDDAVSTNITLPFTFNFNGVNYTTVRINSNGVLFFGANGFSTASSPLSNTTATYNQVAGLGADLNTYSGGSVIYGSTGISPARTFVAEWRNISIHNQQGAGTFNCQIRLSETSNRVSVVYGPATYAGLAVAPQVGVRSGTRVLALGGINAAGWVTPSVTNITSNFGTTQTLIASATSLPSSGRSFFFDPTPAAPVVTASGPLQYCEGTLGFSVTLTAAIGFDNYVWSNGATSRSITVTTPGTYYVNGILRGVTSDTSQTFVVAPYLSSGVETFTDFQSTAVVLPDGASSITSTADDHIDFIRLEYVGNNQVRATASWLAANTGTYSGTNGVHFKMFLIDPSGTVSTLVNLPLAPAQITYGSYQSTSFLITLPENTPAGVHTVRASLIDRASTTDLMTGNFACAGCGVTIDNTRHFDNADAQFQYTRSASAAISLIAGNNPSCQGETVTLSGPTGMGSYLWSNGGTSRTTTISTPGRYYLTTVTTNGCFTTRDSIDIEYLTPPTAPTIEVTGNTNLCFGDSLVLSFVGPGFGFSWNTGDIGRDLIVRSSGTYYGFTFNENGCPSPNSDSIVVRYNLPAPATISGFRHVARVDTKDYYVSATAATITTARTAVATAGGTLANLKTSQIWNAVNANLQSSDFVDIGGGVLNGPYIGLSDQIVEGTFRWSDNTVATATNWEPGQPSNTSNEDFVHILNAAGKWNDNNGTRSLKYLMEVSAVTQVPVITASTTRICVGDFAQLTATEGYSGYVWNTGDTGRSIFVTSPGTYLVSGLLNGCNSVNSLPVSISEGSSANITPFVPQRSTVTLRGDGFLGVDNGDRIDSISLRYLNLNQLQVGINWLPSSTGAYTTTNGIHLKLFLFRPNGAVTQLYEELLSPAQFTVNATRRVNYIFNVSDTLSTGQYTLRAALIDRASSTDVMNRNGGCASCGSNSASDRHFDNADIQFTVLSLPTPTTINLILPSDTLLCSNETKVIRSSSLTGNQWFKNGVPILGATSQDYSVTEPGSYNVSVRLSPIGCPSISRAVTFNSRAILVGDTLTALICEGRTYNFGGGTLVNPGVYSDTINSVNGCDSVIFLNLMVLPRVTQNVIRTICEGQSFNFNGNVLTIEGNYNAVFTNRFGCDSTVNLQLRVNGISATIIQQRICQGESVDFDGNTYSATGNYIAMRTNAVGCDSIVQLSLTVNNPSASTFSASICSGTTYNFNGSILSTQGIYNDTLTNEVGCDSVVTLTLNVRPTSASNISGSICAGTTYNFNGSILSAQGIYRDTLINSVGCDSVITLTLNVRPTSARSISASICAGTTYNFNGTLLNAQRTYRDTLSNSVGCDSVITLTLNVRPTSARSISASICFGTAFNFNGSLLSIQGIYRDTLINAVGCDSVITLTLEVRPTSASSISASICDGTTYNFNGSILTAQGIYRDTLTNSVGCDSVVTLNLNVRPTSATNISGSICSGTTYNFNGSILSIQGIYRDTLSSTVGCDSVVTLILNVRPTSASNISASICDGTTYNFNSSILSAQGIYIDTLSNAVGCDSVITLTLNVRPTSARSISASICAGTTYNFNGSLLSAQGIYRDTLANSVGCDSAITLNLTVLPVKRTTVRAGICPVSVYAFGSQLLTSAGTYRDTLTSNIGCDSIVTLELEQGPIAFSVNPVSICAGSSYNFRGTVLTLPGTYRDTLTDVIGTCDSIVILELSFRPTSTSAISASICSGTTYNFNGDILNTAGIYNDTLMNAVGCDSVITLTLEVRPTSTSAISASICAGTTYNFNGDILTTAGIYNDTLTNSVGCDSVITLTLNVRPTSTSSISASICAGTTYNFNGTLLNTQGIYNDTLVNAVGCDSVITLTLEVRPTSVSSISASICAGTTYNFNGNILSAQGIYNDTLINSVGCDSVITLTLNVRPTSASSISASICGGTTYNFNGAILTTAGIYNDTLVNAVGCDSVVTLTLEVRPTSTSSISASICAGTTYNFNGDILNTSGIYNDTHVNAVGCDSVITLTLNVRPTSTSSISASICSGTTYNFNGAILSTQGIYNDTLVNSAGCDSVITLTLEVRPTSTSSISASICQGASYNFNGAILNTAGIYNDTLVNSVGCDSVVTLTLEVRPTSTSSISASICSGTTYNFNGTLLNAQGIYNDTLLNAVGCDSVITLTLEVRPTSTSSISASICSGTTYNFNGNILSAQGIYNDTLTNAVGCDSVITLTLNVRPTSSSAISASICAGTSYDFNGTILSTQGIYNDTLVNSVGCDSVVTLTLEVRPTSTSSISASICAGTNYNFNGEILTTAGIYNDTLVNAVGCDSVITLTLNVRPTSTSSISASICSGTTYNFNGNILSAQGIYNDTLVNTVGCDSVITLTLNVRPTSTSSISASICAGTTYNFNGTLLNTQGIYNDTLTNAVGCDSVITLTLEVRPTSGSSISASICAGTTYNFNGAILTTAGIYNDTLVNAVGCDSVITLNLEVRPTSASAISASICAGTTYNFNGAILTTAGIYNDTLINSVGCDSVITLTLNVRPVITRTVFEAICEGDIFRFNGQNITFPGVYRDTLVAAGGCDSIVTVNLSINARPITPTLSVDNDLNVFASGSNAVNYIWFDNGVLIQGPISAFLQYGVYTRYGSWIYAIGVGANGCLSDTSNFVFLIGSVKPSALGAQIKIFPVPAESEINIQGITQSSLIQVYDVKGSLVRSLVAENDTVLNIADLAMGTYEVVISNKQGRATKQIMKR
jgi:hypothetical protein